MQNTLLINTQFARDVLDGLSSTPKTLPSRYFYDEEGDRLFQQIMMLKEYYPTRCEYEILDTYKADLLELFSRKKNRFKLIEFGAGDGLKTKVLLEHFLQQKVNFKYIPIDISGNVLKMLCGDLEKTFPDLEVECIEDDYFKALAQLPYYEYTRKVVLFMGANIGNFRLHEAEGFLAELKSHLHKGDMVMTGFDLRKNPDTILSAYDDLQGVTRDFNLNLLRRINRELGADFNLFRFDHYPTYDPATGEARSYLLSREKQVVYLKKLDTHIHFDAWEAIHTEISRKFSLREIEDLAEKTGFRIVEHFFDQRKYFVDSVWEVMS